MGKRYDNLDANESAFFERALTYVKKKIFQKKFPQFKARLLIPTSFEAHAGAESISYSIYEGVGLAKVVSDYANLSKGNVKAKEVIAKVKSLALEFDYNINEIRAAQLSQVNLKDQKAGAIKKGFMATEDSIAFLGDSEHGLYGLFSHPNINRVTVDADGGDGEDQTSWYEKTAAQILRDLNMIAAYSIDVTNGVERADTILMSSKLRAHISGLQMDGINMSVLKFFLENSENITAVETCEQCKVGGQAGGEIVCAYQRDDSTVTLEIPQDFEMFAAQEKGLTYNVPCHQRIGGVITPYPMSITIGEGVAS